MKSAFVLFVAGEDSGDILGESAVRAAQDAGLEARGIGGSRMERAGLYKIAGLEQCSYERFPVSGFLDVLPRALFFKRVQRLLLNEIEKQECVALCAVDYPGLNMKLVQAAKALRKPVLYLEPPQIFAWKAKRAKLLQGCTLAVFFSFEQKAYAEHGVETALVKHPFVEAMSPYFARNKVECRSNKILLLPGSRAGALKRNLPVYVAFAKKLLAQGYEPVFVAARESLKCIIENYAAGMCCELAPKQAYARAELFNSAKVLVAPPGTSLFESVVSGTPVVAAVKPDLMTYTLGKKFLKVPHLALPNLLLNKRVFPEIVVTPFGGDDHAATQIVDAVIHAEHTAVPKSLVTSNSKLVTIYSLSLEFFSKLRAGQTK